MVRRWPRRLRTASCRADFLHISVIETEGNFKGGLLRRTLANIQYAVHKTTHNPALAFKTLVLQMKNCVWVYQQYLLFNISKLA